MRKHVRPASAAYAVMCALVALYCSAVLMFARKSIYKLPLYLLLSGAAIVLLALLSRKEKPRGAALPAQEDAALPVDEQAMVS